VKIPPEQGEFFGFILRQSRQQFRLHVNDIVRIRGRLCRVIRVTESAAVVVMNQPPRSFITRFDKHVRFQSAPASFRISPNSEVEIVNRSPRGRRKPEHERRNA